MIKIETNRLIIIPLSNLQMQETINKESCKEVQTAFIEMYDNSMKYPKDRIWYVIWGIYLKNNLDISIGNLSFKGPSVNGAVEIGYGINNKYQNNGYMTETLIAISNWAIKQENVKVVQAETAIDNIASIRVLEKSGFVYTGKNGQEGPIYKFLLKNKE